MTNGTLSNEAACLGFYNPTVSHEVLGQTANAGANGGLCAVLILIRFWLKGSS